MILLGLIGLAWAIFSWALLARHAAYYSNAYDLGFFDQIIWNTAHGRWFRTTFLSYNFAGQHLEPVLLLFALVYRFWPRVEIILLVQAAVAAWAALPLYFAARRLLASAAAALMVAAAYLLAPQLHGAVLFDFHPEVMGTGAIFAALALLVARRPAWALVAVASLVLLKEDALLVAAGFALIVWLRGYRRHAVGLLAGAALYAILVVGVLMPAIRGGGGDLQERYGYLGTTAPGVLRSAVLHPRLVWQHVSGDAQRRGVAYLLTTQAFLPLGGPAVLAALPELGADLLATHPQQNSLQLHYAVVPFALFLVASLLTVQRLSTIRVPAFASTPARIELIRPRVLALTALLLLAEAAGWLVGSPLGLRFDAGHYRQTPHDAAVARVLRQVPAAVPVSAQSGLLPHLSQRRLIWEFPELPASAVVVVDRKGWRSSQSDLAGYARVLASLPGQGYCLRAMEDGVELYERGDACASRS